MTFQARSCGVGWRTASTISSNQRKLMIVTRALQVNPRKPWKPLEIKAKTANPPHAAMLMFRMRRSTVAASSCSGFGRRSVVIAQPEAEEVEEGRRDTEAQENPQQPRARAEQFVQAPADERSHADGNREHPSDRRGLQELLRLAALLVTYRHCAPPRPGHAPDLPTIRPGRPAGSAGCR